MVICLLAICSCVCLVNVICYTLFPYKKIFLQSIRYRLVPCKMNFRREKLVLQFIRQYEIINVLESYSFKQSYGCMKPDSRFKISLLTG